MDPDNIPFMKYTVFRGSIKSEDHLKCEAGKDKIGAPLMSLPPDNSTNPLLSNSNRSLKDGEGAKSGLCLVRYMEVAYRISILFNHFGVLALPCTGS